MCLVSLCGVSSCVVLLAGRALSRAVCCHYVSATQGRAGRAFVLLCFEPHVSLQYWYMYIFAYLYMCVRERTLAALIIGVGRGNHAFSAPNEWSHGEKKIFFFAYTLF